MFRKQWKTIAHSKIWQIGKNYKFKHLVQIMLSCTLHLCRTSYSGYVSYKFINVGLLICLTSESCKLLLSNQNYNLSIPRTRPKWDATTTMVTSRASFESLLRSFGTPSFSSKIYVAEAFIRKGSSTELNVHEAYGVADGEQRRHNLVESWTGFVSTFRAEHIWKRRSDLLGKEMKIFTIHGPPLYSVDPDRPEENSGQNIEILKELSRRMNFTIRYLYVNKESFGTKQVSWILRSLSEDKFDMSALFLFMTPERREDIVFSNPIAKTNRLLATKRDLRVSRTKSILEVFDSIVWYCLGLSMTLLLLARLLSCRLTTCGDQSRLTFYYSLLEEVMTVCGACLSQGTSRDVRNTSFRVLLWTSLVFGVLFVNALSAKLISTLSSMQEELFVKSLEDVKKYDLKLFISRGGFTEDDFKNSPPGSLKKHLWDNDIDHAPDYFYGKDMVAAFLQEDRESAIIVNPIYLAMFLISNKPRGCGLVSSGLKFGAQDVVGEYKLISHCRKPTSQICFSKTGIPLRKSFQYTQALNYHLVDMVESGVMDRIYSSYAEVLKKTEKESCSSLEPADGQELKKVDLIDVRAFFLLLATGAIFSIATAVYEAIAIPTRCARTSQC